MGNIICSLEEWDSVIDYYRPNGASKTWYLKELKKLSRPLMWGDWNIFTEDGDMFDNGMFRNIITPNFSRNIKYTPFDEIGEQKHIHIINIYSHTFFVDNEEIGFKCVSPKYLEDIKNGKCKIVMLFLYEGYSGSLGNNDFEIIEKWRIESELPEGSVYYVCGNFLCEDIVRDRKLGIKARPVHYFEPWNKYHDPEIAKFNPLDDKYLFLSYNRQPRHHRITLMFMLLEIGLFDKGLISLNKLNFGKPQHANQEHADYLWNNSPFIIDDRYSLFYNLACNITKEDYERTFISLVTETLVDDGTLFFSEKVWKPIMVGHPFLLYGNQYSLRYLKSLGYQTFDRWIDESYDNEPNRDLRCGMIVNELNKFKNKSIDELKQIREEMNEVCIFNQQHYKKLYSEKYDNGDVSAEITKIFDDIWEELNG
jgi:hypothetical protein